MDSAERSLAEETAVSKQAAVLDLPPAPPAYVEVCQHLSAPQSKEIIAALKGGGDHDPPEPPHHYEHTEEDSEAFQEDAFRHGAFQT
jgi:hypothetical protein